ncbi:hypothetical protein MRX96_044056 [Rhipicephalus microplus]
MDEQHVYPNSTLLANPLETYATVCRRRRSHDSLAFLSATANASKPNTDSGKARVIREISFPDACTTLAREYSADSYEQSPEHPRLLLQRRACGGMAYMFWSFYRRPLGR